MAFITSRIDDDTITVVECETSGAFSKSDMEIRPDPERALFNSVDLIAKLAATIAVGVGPAIMNANAAGVNIDFAIKIDSNGSVMIAQNHSEGQLRVAIRWSTAGA